MKNTLKWYGIIALIAVIGFSLAACGDDDGNGGGGGGSGTITVTGIPATVGGINHNGFAIISLYSDIEMGNRVAVGTASLINNGSVTWSLTKPDDYTPFTGSGSYYLSLAFSDTSGNYSWFTYADGKYAISSKNTIDFSKFVNW
jgi:hypothetical protein